MTAQAGVLVGIERLKRHGFTFLAVSGRLRVSPGKHAKMTTDRLSWIEKNKDAILECLEPVPSAPVNAGSAATLPPDADSLVFHTVAELERLIECNIAHGAAYGDLPTLERICSDTDETPLAVALVLADMETRGIIRFEYRELDGGPPYYEEFITLPESPPLPVGVKRWQVLQGKRVIFESDMYEMAIAHRDSLCSGRDDCREKGVALRQNTALPKLTNAELRQILGEF